MVRKGFWCGLSFMSGLFLANCFSIKLWWVFALCACAAGLLGAVCFKSIRRYFIVCSCSFVLATVYCAAYTHFVYDDLISYDGKEIVLDAYVTDFNYTGHGQGYLTVKGRIGSHTTKISFLVEEDDYEYYDDVTIRGKVSVIKDNFNFKAQDYYFGQGVFLKGSGAASVTLKGTNSHSLLRNIRKYSDKVFNTIINYGGYEEKGFLAAMLCGDKSEMDPVQKSMLYRSGIGHIFAVSGAHLVILTYIIGQLIGLIIKNKKIHSAVMLLVTWAFVVFAGMSVSVIRSAIMMSVLYAGDMSLRRSDSANSLGIAGIILCLANPYCVHSAAFLLSFSSAFAAGVVSPAVCTKLGIEGKQRGFYSPKAAVTALTVSIFISPVCLIFYGGFSVVSPFTNILLIPLCSLALMICFAVALTGCAAFIAKPLLWAASGIVKLVFSVVRIISKPAFLYITGQSIAAVIIIAIVCTGVIIIMCSSKKPFITLSAVFSGALVCILCSNIFVLMNYDKLDFYVFSNKNNCSVITVNSDRALIVDLSNSAKFIGAQMRVIQHKGVKETEAVLVNSEPYFTISRYNSELYPQADFYISGTQVPMDMQDVYEVDPADTVELNDIIVTRLENGFELEYNDIKYSFYPDRFTINEENYDTNGVSVQFSSDDNTVRRLDYELGFTDYTW